MKGKDIVKAVECCKDDAIFCVDCPYYDENGEHEQLCVYRLHKDFLDFINRLKAERNKYKIKAQYQKGELARLNKQVAEQKAEIERLREELDGETVENMRLEHEIERLSQPVFIMETKEMTEEEIKRLLRKPAMVTIKPSDNTIRNETIKEFAERLTEHIPHFDDGYTTMECVKGAVNYLVKEMTEVNNNAEDNM